MALPDEQADILGGPILQRPESGLFAALSPYYFVFKMVALVGFALLAWVVFVRGIEQIKRRREFASRKAMRRKHGIPDSDCRPFAVAYAAARRARVEREAQERTKTTNQISDHLQPVIDQRTYVQKDAHGLRRRIPETTAPFRDQYLPAKRAAVYESRRSDPNLLNFADRYNPNPRSREVIPPTPPRRPTGRRASRKNLFLDARVHEESRKRSLADESESDNEHETTKKSRIDGDELIDGDEHADWYAQYSNVEPRRLSHESPDRQVVGTYVEMDGPGAFGRADNAQDEDHGPADEAMEGIDEDEITELRSVVRGKKRDRAEAGSTFGGDDEEEVQNGKMLHHRKRRTISQRQSGLLIRGHKRGREFEMPESDGDGDVSETSRSYAKRTSKKKKGKKAASDETSEISPEDPRISKDPLCGGRGIGDEWEADGIQYKVGVKGERLRLALVKKARNKYHMPEDSQHPDRSASLEIYVETWLTDAQYQQAEERQDLAWQDAPSSSNGSKTPDVLESPPKTGKNLLWDSVKGSPARRPFRQSTSTGARINPFEQVQSQSALGRRVASSSTIASPIFPGIADSPTRPGFRGFSKWEKQDREAEAMARIRAKLEEQKKVQTPKPTELPSVTAPELASKPMSVPTITLTPAAPVSAKLDDTLSQSKPTSTFTFSPTSEPSKATTSTNITGSSFSPTALPSATPPLIPTSLAAPTATSGATPSTTTFSFTKSPQIPSSASTSTTAPSSSSMPNFFGKTSSASPSSVSGTTTQIQPTSTDSAAKPTMFSLGKSDTPSSTTAPAAASPLIFSTAPSTSASTSSFTLGSTPAATKVETLAPTARSSEATKPSAPIFSFSAAPTPLSTAPPAEAAKPPAPVFSFSATPSSTTPAPSVEPATYSAPSASKFSFGTSSAPSASFSPASAASQPKSTLFNLGQTSMVPPNSGPASTSAIAVHSKKPEPSPVPPSVFGSTAGPKDVQPSPFGPPSAFGGSAFAPSSTSETNIFGKPPAAGIDTSNSVPKPTSAATASNMFSATPAGSSTSGAVPMSAFSFGGVNSGSHTAEGSKPTPLFGAEGSKPASVFGGSTIGSTSTFASTATLESSKPVFALGGETTKPTSSGTSVEGPKPTFSFNGASTDSSKPASVNGGVESSKSTFSFGSSTETSKPSFSLGGAAGSKPPSAFGGFGEGFKQTSFSANGTDASKSSLFGGTGAAVQPQTAFPAASFGSSSSPSPFTFGNKADTTTSFTSASSKPTSTFSFGGSSGTTGSVFGQPPAPSTGGDEAHLIFGKPASATPSAFGFNAPSTSTSAFNFNKPPAQNQKQEQ